MRLFRRKSNQPPVDPLATTKGRQALIEKLESLGYFVRPRSIRRPKVGDTVKFISGAAWSLNTRSYCTATVIEWESPSTQRGAWMRDCGYVRAQKKSADGHILIDAMVHPYLIVRVSKARKPRGNK